MYRVYLLPEWREFGIDYTDRAAAVRRPSLPRLFPALSLCGAAMRFVEIDGKRHAWRDIIALRREQARRERQPQPTLFELKDDVRPPSKRSAAGRYREPSLFDGQAR